MLKQDKTKILSFLFCAFYIVITILFIKFSNLIPPYIVAIIGILGLYVYAVPHFLNSYYKLYSKEIGLVRYVPFYSEFYLIPSNAASIGYFVTLGGMVLSLAIVVLNPSIYVGIVGYNIAESVPMYALGIFFLLLIVFSLVKGFAYLKAFRDINARLVEYAGKNHVMDSIMNIASYVLIFIPLFRMFSLIYYLGFVDRLCAFTVRANTNTGLKKKGE